MKSCLRLSRLSHLLIVSFSCIASMTACASPAAPGHPGKTAVTVSGHKQTAKKKAPAQEDEFVNFSQWSEVSRFIDDMKARNGFDKEALKVVMSKVRYLDTAIELVKPAPVTKPKNWQAYRARFVEAKRINAGVEFWNDHALALGRAEEQYGVPAEIIVAILGVETVYGRNTGNFRVMDAITTLAFAYPPTANRDARMAYFRGELENTLLLARETHIDPFSLMGSYAGAIGWPQFMPGSIRQYAVDFDGDGKVDLRASPVDAIGSVANFLKIHGWQQGDPTVFPANVSAAVKLDDLLNQGLEAKFSLDELQAAGVVAGRPIPTGLRLGVIDLQNGDAPTEYWLATNNFFAVTQYNRSYFYAMSVVELAKAIRAARHP